MPKEFAIEREVVLPADPDRVFAAVSTMDGLSHWLFPMPVPGPEEAAVWDPPHRFSHRMEQGEWFNAIDHVIEGRAGGTSVLRYVHSGVFMDDWDNQFDGASQHTDFYLHTLAEYLGHFDGLPVAYVGDVPGGLAAPEGTASSDGFDRLKAALGVGATASVGQEVTLPVGGEGQTAGVVDYSTANFLGIRTADALYRFFGRNAFGAPVGMSVHLFGDDADAAGVRAAWEAWLETSLA